MTATEGKKKKPPQFPYHPKSCARRLKKSWIEDRKIRSQWKAQKKREGLTSQTSALVEGNHNLTEDEAHTNSDWDASPNCTDKSPMSSPSHASDKWSLRDLRKIAYTSKPLSAQRSDSLGPKGTPRHSRSRGGKATVGHERSQPNMKLRMNVLLEKIKRDFS